ncbi:unnamed protein product [Brachionus calyciflorus]|uniref:Uncharacterized protein n=1 Tax=Brachionus calyciflorus TaxID=104777 RepID=A0A814LE29_9BILA|nr:unnamed protein product [Brachionus calyciflorus]
MAQFLKIRVSNDQPDQKLAKAKLLGQDLVVPFENLNEEIEFDELEENAFYNFKLKETKSSNSLSFRCELISKSQKRNVFNSPPKRR